MIKKRAVRIVIAILISAVGIIFVLLDIAGIFGQSQNLSALAGKIGLSLLVAGIVSLFHETLLGKLELDETTEKLVAILREEHLKEAEMNAENTALCVCEKLRKSPIGITGIRLVSSVRKGWKGYYLWAINKAPEELFFAGRSVLHRIDQDFKSREIGSAEALLARRLREGSRIRIMILSPESDLIPRLAKEERQTPEQLLSDIATSLGVCKRLYKLLLDQPPKRVASLDIRFYDEVPYFAYHRVDDDLVVGFYFQDALGHSSAAYELVDQETKKFFDGHFSQLFQRAEESVLLKVPAHRQSPDFNEALMDKYVEIIRQSIGDKVDRFIKGIQLSTST